MKNIKEINPPKYSLFICGSSGSGKSTLMRIILRNIFDEAPGATIRISSVCTDEFKSHKMAHAANQNQGFLDQLNYIYDIHEKRERMSSSERATVEPAYLLVDDLDVVTKKLDANVRWDAQSKLGTLITCGRKNQVFALICSREKNVSLLGVFEHSGIRRCLGIIALGRPKAGQVGGYEVIESLLNNLQIVRPLEAAEEMRKQLRILQTQSCGHLPVMFSTINGYSLSLMPYEPHIA